MSKRQRECFSGLLAALGLMLAGALGVGGCGSQAGAPSCSKDGWCVVATLPGSPNFPGPAWRLWGSSSRDVWLVGPSGQIQHWDGARFSSVSSGVSVDLGSISGSSSTDVWVSGFPPYSGGGPPPILLHWNGTGWGPPSSQVPGFPASLPVSTLYGLAKDRSPSEVWFEGADGSPPQAEYLLWNGSAIAKYPPLPSIHGFPASASWISGPNDIWLAGGGGGIMRWNGSGWVSVPSGTTATLMALSGSGPNDIWCGGEAGLIHWNGSAWSPASPLGEGVSGLWSNSPNDAWLVGWVPGAAGDLRHWNGTAWTPFDIGNPAGGPMYFYSTGPSDAWLVAQAPGATSPANARQNILHWTGQPAPSN